MAEPTNALAPYAMADYLQGRTNAMLDRGTGLTPGFEPLPQYYSYPPSEFTSPAEMQQERISQMFGWDTSRPGREFLRRALFELPLAMRSSAGARIGTDHTWASQTPSAVLGDGRLGSAFAGVYAPAFARPSARDMRGAPVTPYDMGFHGPSAPANSNIPQPWAVKGSPPIWGPPSRPVEHSGSPR